jgi:hypothetical protein
MKYLNKIVFINSADKSLKYAEVNLDGNVHFIGTQGVGKSTLLRAILFFYNADKQKLGIPREKKTFDEYYFPFQNSYIIYEVKTETGSFCVLAFKSQSRVAFRFFDSVYYKDFFLDNEGKVYESWDKIRESFGRNINYTKIISSYEEYRNILYGYNKGLSNEFRKYALLESKQYQNIPRTITNVFLNTKLDAEFVKETIIKSLNEDEIKIDLETYKSHLKDFETQLYDIQKWTEKNLEKQADNVSKFYSALKFLEKKKEDYASQLGWALNNVKEQQPKVLDFLRSEELKKKKAEDKLRELDGVFEKKKGEIQKLIGEFSSKLKDISTKRKHYESLNINEIINRVAAKSSLEFEQKNLIIEKEILTSKFLEIQQRFEALLAQLINQFKEFENNKQTEKNTADKNFLNFKENLNRQYETIFETIKTQHKAELEAAQSLVKEKENAITEQKIRQAELKNKKFYVKEIEIFQIEIGTLKSKISNAENTIRQANEVKRNLEKEWQLDEKGIKNENARKIEKQTDIQAKLKEQINAIDTKIENSKNSLYGWLNEQMPAWENTIGKVIDVDNVLFKSGLNPQKVSNNNSNFYGINIDLHEISKEVKTVADYEQEKSDLQNQINNVLKTISSLNGKMEKDLENLRIKFHKKIKEQKETVQTNDYTIDISKTRLDEIGVKLIEWENKAKSDKKAELDKIEIEINRLSEEKIKADEQVTKIGKSIDENINKKKKEKEVKVKVEQQNLNDIFSKIDLVIKSEKEICNKKQAEIRQRQRNELDSKGADTTRIAEIDLRLEKINDELVFIDKNRDKVAEYNKDKRELFDKEATFKNQKTSHENQLQTEKQKYDLQKDKFIQEIGQHNAEINSINQAITAFNEDIKNFETFKNSEVFLSIENFVTTFSDNNKTEIRCTEIINEINQTHYTINSRCNDLQEAINKFTGNFQEHNLFSFKTKFITRSDYFDFAEMLKEFIDENKISEYKKRVEERFAHIIRQIGSETNELISKEGEISQVVKEINNDFVTRNFVGAIKSMELRTEKSANTIFQLLVEIKNFNDENTFDLGAPNLFSSGEQVSKNEKAILLLKQLSKEMSNSREKEILLSDSFELQFKIVENNNDTGWVEKLANVGSEGTDTLVKAMINIMLLNVFKDRATRKNKGDFSLHCMMDEIGKLHPNNVKGILQFANDRNILLINCSPTSYNAADYRYTYLLSKDTQNVTSIKKLVSKK